MTEAMTQNSSITDIIIPNHSLDVLYAVEQNKRCCKICGKQYSINTSSSILKRHFRTIHKKEININQIQKKGTNSESFPRLFMSWIINDLQPISIMESLSFRKMIRSIAPYVTFPSQKNLLNMISEQYQGQKTKLIQDLKNADSMISLTLDLWTSDSGDTYIIILAHYIDNSWMLQNILLAINQFDLQNSNISISQKLIYVTNMFNISHKILSVTTCGEVNMTREIMLFSETIKRNHGIQPIQYCCASDIIDLTIKKGHFKTNQTIQKIRKLIKFILNSPLFVQGLKFYQNDQFIQLETLLDCPMKWDSTLDMLSGYLKLHVAFKKLSDDHMTICEFLPSEEELQEIRNICEILEPFKIASNIFTSVSCTMSNVLIAYKGLKIILEEQKYNNCDKMIQVLAKYTENYGLDMLIPVFLDPETKDEYFQDSFENFKMNFNYFFNNYNFNYENIVSNQEENSRTELSYFTSIISKKRKSIQPINEIERYSSIPKTGNSNLLMWWKNNAREFPVLAKMAADYLACQPTSTGCKKLFSVIDLNTNCFKDKLDTETIEMLLCLHRWKKEEFSDNF